MALVCAGVLLVPTGAVPFTDATDTVGADVELAPADGSNGMLAYLDEDGELVIDISPTNPNIDAEGVSSDGITRFDDVFVVRYTGSETARVWVTVDAEAITFHTTDGPIDAEARNVTLESGESVGVGMTVDTTEVTSIDSDEFTVHATGTDSGDRTASQTPSGPDPGSGTSSGSDSSLRSDRSPSTDVDSENATDDDSGSETPQFVVRETDLRPQQIELGESVTVEATVANVGSAVGETTVEFKIEGRTVESRTVRLPPNETAELAADVSPDEPGEFTIAVQNVSVGVLIVDSSMPADESTTVEPSTPETPGDATPTTSVEPAGSSLPPLRWLVLLAVGVVGILAYQRYRYR